MSFIQILHLAVFGSLLIFFAKKLPKFSLYKPVAYTMLLSLVFLMGFIAVKNMPMELMPNYSYGNVTVYVDVRGGMPPPDVERLITKPVEEAMATVSKMKNLVSTSKKHRSVVTLEFDPGTNMSLATLEVREKFLRIKHKLPQEIERPVIAHYEENDAPVVIAALTSPNKTPEELRELVDDKLKERLLRTEGVANVEIGGGRERKIVVNIDKNRLEASGLSIKKVVGILEQNNLNMRVGEMQDNVLSFGLRTIGSYKNVDEIKNIGLVIGERGGVIRLKDIADVKDSYLEAESYSRLNSKSAVTLYIQKESLSNTVKVVKGVKKVIDSFKETQKDDVEVLIVSDQGKAILQAIKSVEITLLYGAVLVVLVISIFLCKTSLTRTIAVFLNLFLLGNLLFCYFSNKELESTLWLVGVVLVLLGFFAIKRKDLRPSFIVAFSIPISLAITVCLMYAEKLSLNVISLSGLVLGIGLLVDNSIVVLENFDRMRSRKKELDLKSQIEVSTSEIVMPMIGGTLTTVVVFLPFSLLQKQTQVMYADIAFTVTASLFASLFASLSIVPALASQLEEPEKEIEYIITEDQKKHSLFTRFMCELRYTKYIVIGAFNAVMDMVLRLSIYGRTILFGIFAVLMLIYFKVTFKMPWDTGFFVSGVISLLCFSMLMFRYYLTFLHWCIEHKKIVIGTVALLFMCSILIFAFRLPKDFMAASEKNDFVIFVELASGVKLDISDKIVREVEKRVNDSQELKGMIQSVSSRVEGWSSKVYVTLSPRSQRNMSTQEVIEYLRPKMDKLGQEYDTFVHFSEPVGGKEIFLEIYGHSYEQLSKLAMQMASLMSKVKEFSDIKVRYRPGRPEVKVVIDSNRVSMFGLTNQEVGEGLHAQLLGLRATTFYDKNEEIETVVRLNPEQCKTIKQLKTIVFLSPYGFFVPVDHIANLVFDLSPSEIWHRNKSRMIQISANLGNIPLENAAKISKDIIKQIRFPQDYYADIGGDYEQMVEANKSFWQALILTVILIYVVMACLFESMIQPFIIMMTVALSIIGAVAALVFSGSTVTLGVSIGLLMLGGIVVNNGIMLVARINTLKERYGKEVQDVSMPTIIIWAAKHRIRPIFMTTTTTVLGLLPMALDRSEASILWSPLAITVIGGLISSTIFTLFVVPCFYAAVEGLKERFHNHYRSYREKRKSKL